MIDVYECSEGRNLNIRENDVCFSCGTRKRGEEKGKMKRGERVSGTDAAHKFVMNGKDLVGSKFFLNR